MKNSLNNYWTIIFNAYFGYQRGCHIDFNCFKRRLNLKDTLLEMYTVPTSQRPYSYILSAFHYASFYTVNHCVHIDFCNLPVVGPLQHVFMLIPRPLSWPASTFPSHFDPIDSTVSRMSQEAQIWTEWRKFVNRWRAVNYFKFILGLHWRVL